MIVFKKILLLLLILGIHIAILGEDVIHFVVIVPSYNNAKWVQKNLKSIFNQDYPYFRVIYINDASQDKTGKLALTYIKKYNMADRCTYIENETNQGALCSLYQAIHSCEDNEIIVLLDGDDWFAHSQTLTRVALEYKNPNVWLTYGQYTHNNVKKYGLRGCCAPIEEEIIKANTYRGAPWRTSHLRTFYAKLFKLILYDDLQYNEKFFKVTWDLAILFPMLEMAQERHAFIPDILYVYNTENCISDFKIYAQEQINMEKYIRDKKSYSRIESLFS
jgi:glycosyltransferase involved in cell wall biosynthesis